MPADVEFVHGAECQELSVKKLFHLQNDSVRRIYCAQDEYWTRSRVSARGV